LDRGYGEYRYVVFRVIEFNKIYYIQLDKSAK